MENRRALSARWTITADLVLISAAQIGSQESDYCDSTFARTSDGTPFLAGATLAGALRSALCDTLSGYRQSEPVAVGELFGALDHHESALILFDSFGCTADDPISAGIGCIAEASIRDGVRLDLETATALDGFKYDREILLPGCVFPLRFDLLIDAASDEGHLLSYFIAVLNSLANGEVHLGARKSRGLGKVACLSFRAIRYDLAQISGWREYAQSASHLAPLTPQVEAFSTPVQAISKAYQALPLTEINDNRSRLMVTLSVALASPLIIRSPGIHAADPDNVQLTEHGKALLSGASVAGALRAQAIRITQTLNFGASLVDDLFGTSPENMVRDDIGAMPMGSRIRVSEAYLEGAKTYEHTRDRIDRFTGGSVDGALFTESPVVGGLATLNIEVRNPKRADMALMTHLCRDLVEGLITIGGEAAAGRGCLTGSAILSKSGSVGSVRVAPGKVECDEPEALSECLKALLNEEDYNL
ncbi:hypothetical protein CCAX7_35750 [Capsulimonas corticalis]|uniref:CRISPR type III-associated protein domain-containing protein n=1 Tax=Capsulimonas corticalis TaxID=2219043 RepID=A0A402D611_9BACT|nr:RAMP superfamily CRISPR-associated protein [Capsulimonas corticalis]BDI31524.1 hypothetical protein CCAX7_35750 [Capsulimonas corticalis]